MNLQAALPCCAHGECASLPTLAADVQAALQSRAPFEVTVTAQDNGGLSQLKVTLVDPVDASTRLIMTRNGKQIMALGKDRPVVLLNAQALLRPGEPAPAEVG